MPRTSLTLLLLLAATPVSAGDFLEPVAKRACACLTDILATRQGNPEGLTAQAGICILKSFEPADREAILEKHGIDLSDPRNGSRAGEIVGARMVVLCPDEVLTLANGATAPRTTKLAGEVVRVEEEGFVVLTIRDEAGKTTKIHWLGAVTSNKDLPAAYRKLAGSRVEATFEVVDLFDPRIGEYRAFRQLKTLTIR